MRTTLLAVALTSLTLGCKDEEQREIKELKAQVSALREELRQLSAEVKSQSHLRRDLDAFAQKNMALSDSLARLEPLADYVFVNDNGDVVVEGANLVIRNGLGKTACSDVDAPDCNGKGNVIVGYAEEPAQCTSGPWQGDACISASSRGECTGCMQSIEPQRTGSHNLLLGRGQQYTSYSGVLLGEYSTVRAPRAVQLGVYGVINEREGTILAGKYNRIEQAFGVVVSGDHNTVAYNGATVFGGNRRTAGETDDGRLVSYTPDIVGMESAWRRANASASEEE